MNSYEELARALPTFTTTDASFASASLVAAGVSTRIELLLFANRFCAVIVGYVAARERLGELLATVRDRVLPKGTAIDDRGEVVNLDDFQYELQLSHEGDCEFIEESIRLNGATALLAASAALELLVHELDRGGSKRTLRQAILDLTDTVESRRLADSVIRRRNMLAHTLDGSYWSSSQARIDLSESSTSVGLADIGRLVDLIDRAL